MSTVIEGYVSGDDLDIQRNVTGITPTDPVVKAWLTIKTAPSVADPGTLQKVITTSQAVGTGQITQDGSTNNGNGTASFVFQLTAVNTTSLGAAVRYYYDVQFKTASGKIFTPEIGRLQLSVGITDASS